MVTRLGLSLLLLVLPNSQPQLTPSDDPSIDYYCGIHWTEANTYCSLPCPSGSDIDCPPANDTGRPRQCYASAGCVERREELTWYGVLSLEFDRLSHRGGFLEGADRDVLGGSLSSLLIEAMSSWDGMDIPCVDVLEQEYDRPCVAAVLSRRVLEESSNNNATEDYYCGASWMEARDECRVPCPSRLDEDCPQDPDPQSCYAATGCIDRPSSTSLDVEVRICSVYIPQVGSTLITPSDLDREVTGIIRRQESRVVQTLTASSSSFFDALTGIAAISNEDVAESPSEVPSESPTRPIDVAIETYLDSRPSGSYGLFFTLKTHVNVSSLLLTGMSFLTPHEGDLEYEVYSRVGPYQGYEGYLADHWELTAKGQTVGRGLQEFTRVWNEDDLVKDDDTLGYLGFVPVHVPGNGGLRSFYITMTKTFTMDGLLGVPVSFSSSKEAENEGKYKYEVVVSNRELEIVEGDGVLEYPAPKNRNAVNDQYYRRPRGFIGSFEYTRDACHPTTGENVFVPHHMVVCISNLYIDFYGWPCPIFVKKQPTNFPTTIQYTEAPTIITESVETTPVPRNNTMPTSSPVEFSNITVFSDGGMYFVNSDFSYADGESLVFTDNTTLRLSGGSVVAPDNSVWPAVRLSMGSIINATAGMIRGSNVGEDIDEGGDGIQLNNGQSSTETAGYGEFYDGTMILGGKGRIGGDALVVNGFGTKAVIYGGEFSGGPGIRAELNGYSIRVINSATVHIHGGTFTGDIKVEGNGLVYLYGCFTQDDTTVSGLFSGDIEGTMIIDGDVMFMPAADQECETLPSVSPTNFPTSSPRPTPPISNRSNRAMLCHILGVIQLAGLALLLKRS